MLAGALLAMYPPGAFFGSPVGGARSDRIGRKRVPLLSLVVTTLSCAVIASSLQWVVLPLLFAACFVCAVALVLDGLLLSPHRLLKKGEIT